MKPTPPRLRDTASPPRADRSHGAVKRTSEAAAGAHRGNKASLPSKPCAACGLPMTWRRRWAKNWAEVKYCSDACRRAKVDHG